MPKPWHFSMEKIINRINICTGLTAIDDGNAKGQTIHCFQYKNADIFNAYQKKNIQAFF